MKFPLGIMADSLRLPIWDAVIKSAELGANGVQIYAVGGEFCFENIPDTKRSQYKSLLGDLGISISALCGDFGGHGFQIPADNPKRLRESRKVMDLAVSLDCKVVTTHIGAIPTTATANATPFYMKPPPSWVPSANPTAGYLPLKPARKNPNG